MIVFHDPLKMLSSAGWSTYRLIREKQISNGSVMRLRHGLPITTETMDTICRLCHCQPQDICHYEPDRGEERG